MSKVRAKFLCTYVEDQPDYKKKSVTFYTVTDGCEENKSFSTYIPSGNLQMAISYDTPACNAFEQGKEYYLDFTEAPKA